MPSRKIGRIQYGKTKIVLHFTNGEKLSLHPDLFINRSFYVNKEINEEEYQSIVMDNTLNKDFIYAKNYCLKHHLSYQKFLSKLLDRGLEIEAAKHLINQLIEFRLYNEQEHLDDLVHSYNLNNKGYYYIIDKLSQKGFSPNLIDALIYKEELEQRKINNQLAILLKKYRHDNDKKLHEHIKNALLQQGFKINIINRALNDLPHNEHQNIMISLNRDYQKALRLYKKKYLEPELKEKVIKYLLLKGYSYIDIMEVVNAVD